jgi:hypothetical protein
MGDAVTMQWRCSLFCLQLEPLSVSTVIYLSRPACKTYRSSSTTCNANPTAQPLQSEIFGPDGKILLLPSDLCMPATLQSVADAFDTVHCESPH